ncbi:MAG: S1 family peptidase, partial [Bacteroidales bacterium]|nr:S1 family peptidase [Bacteroidales bacterium]
GDPTLPPCEIGLKTADFLNTLASWIGSSSRLRTYRIQQTENKVDCAIAKPVNPEEVINEILGFGQIAGITEAELGMQIKKSGRTTGLTYGTIEQTNVTARVSYGVNKTALFTDQFMAGDMNQGGDSGSAVLSEDNNLVGLLFAGSDTTTLMNRIGNVFSALNISLP